MSIQLTEEERMVQKTARDFARKDIAAVVVESNRDGVFREDIYRKLAELGFMGMTMPEEYGGVGFTNLSLALALEEISRVCPSTAIAVSVHNSLANYMIYTWGNDSLKQRYLPRMTSGDAIGVYALTEPNAGSDVAAVSMSAERDGDDYVLNGSKIFISTGDKAGVIIVIARTNPAGRSRGLSAFVVEPDFPGFSIGKIEHKMGMKASTTVELVFEDCRVPASNVIGKEGQGMQIALGSLDGGRIGIAAQSLGIAQTALDEAVFFGRERQQFGNRIVDFQATRWKIADMGTNIEAARLLVYHAARLRDAGESCSKQASMAKLFASRIANEAVYDALQIHGGVGYTEEFKIERFFRDARVLEIYEGTSEIQRIVISKKILEEYEQMYPV
ncbi:MAG TPA: acyl-CoA dehydrogenase [Candidatus Eisenbacteria bacterium]|uniref:Acyl-CoA dehydrogenase n=1 Tax=Eiseniibacteriota bacterium TaxID=2212470 RepID=A0A7V2F428_UNCEI|nr:acyl-CoA dehydrogenase [Candidatus Eisenbacteria bacterium]